MSEKIKNIFSKIKKYQHCKFKRFELSENDKSKLRNDLWKKWEELNKEFETFSHKINLTQLLTQRKKQLENELREIESVLKILEQKKVFCDSS